MEKRQARGEPGQEAPFIWQSQSALDTISGIYNTGHRRAIARSIYFALTELANDKGVRFEAPHMEISNRAGLESTRWVKEYLIDLEKAELIKIEHPNGHRAKWYYTLLSKRQSVIRQNVIRLSSSRSTSQRYIKKKKKGNSNNWEGVNC
jgi:hypothetical protein